MMTAWSTEVFDTSIEPMPSVSTRMRSPWKPRRIGTRCAGAERGGGDARQPLQRLADGGAQIAGQLFAPQHGRALQDVGFRLLEEAGDDHFLAGHRMGGGLGRGGQGDSQRQQADDERNGFHAQLRCVRHPSYAF